MVSYIYNGRVELTVEKSAKLIPASVSLMLPELTKACNDFLLHKVSHDASACIDIHRNARVNSLTDVANKAWQVMLEKFTEISQLDSFKEMSKTELQEYIKDEGLNVANENPVFEAVVTWVRHDEVSRKASFDHIVESINFSHCSPSFLGDVIRKEALMNTASGMRKVADAQHHYLSTNAVQHSTARRGYSGENALVAICKDYSWMLKPGEAEWVNLRSSVGKKNSFSHACMTRDGILLTGGKSDDQGIKVCWKFSLSKLDWVAMPDLNVARLCHTTVSVGNRIYAIGGRTGQGDNFKQLQDVEFLDETTGSWHVTRELLSALYSHTGVAYKHFIFIFGGCDTDFNQTKRTFMLDTKCHNWSRKADMPVVCDRGSSVVYKDRIYVLGGEDNRCASYDPDQDQWKTHSRPAVAHDRASAVVLKDRILLCGGTDTSVIEEYNPDTDTWRMWRYQLPETSKYPAVFAVHL